MLQLLNRFFSGVNRFWRGFQLSALVILGLVEAARKNPEVYPAYAVRHFNDIQLVCLVAMITAQITKKQPDEVDPLHRVVRKVVKRKK